MLRHSRRCFTTNNSSLLSSAKEMLKDSDTEFKIKKEYLPKQFADVVLQKRQKKPDYGDYENSKVTFNFQDDFEF
jgi:hypothetical protein